MQLIIFPDIYCDLMSFVMSTVVPLCIKVALVHTYCSQYGGWLMPVWKACVLRVAVLLQDSWDSVYRQMSWHIPSESTAIIHSPLFHQCWWFFLPWMQHNTPKCCYTLMFNKLQMDSNVLFQEQWPCSYATHTIVVQCSSDGWLMNMTSPASLFCDIGVIIINRSFLGGSSGLHLYIVSPATNL